MGFRDLVLGGSGLGFVGSARRAIVTERSCLVFWGFWLAPGRLKRRELWGLFPGSDSRSLLRKGLGFM